MFAPRTSPDVFSIQTINAQLGFLCILEPLISGHGNKDGASGGYIIGVPVIEILSASFRI